MAPPNPIPPACPDGGVYARLNDLEQAASVHEERWKSQRETNRKRERDIDGLCDSVTRLSTTIKVATAIMGFLLALAGVVVPLWKG